MKERLNVLERQLHTLRTISMAAYTGRVHFFVLYRTGANFSSWKDAHEQYMTGIERSMIKLNEVKSEGVASDAGVAINVCYFY